MSDDLHELRHFSHVKQHAASHMCNGICLFCLYTAQDAGSAPAVALDVADTYILPSSSGFRLDASVIPSSVCEGQQVITGDPGPDALSAYSPDMLEEFQKHAVSCWSFLSQLLAFKLDTN